MTKEDQELLLQYSTRFPLYALLGSFLFAVIYSPSFMTVVSTRQSASALIKFALSSLVFLSNRYREPSTSGEISISDALLLLVAICVQVLHYRAQNPSSSSLPVVIEDILPSPLAELAHWTRISSTVLTPSFFSQVLEYSSSLFKELSLGPSRKSLDHFLVAMFVFLATALFIYRYIKPHGKL